MKPVHIAQGGPKNGLFLRLDNFATVNGMKACDISKVSELLSEKNIKMHVNAIRCSLLNLHKYSLHVKLC